MRLSPTDPTVYLLDPPDIEQDSLPDFARAYRGHAAKVLEWAHEYLCRPHADLGRDGPVCPYTEPSLERALFWLTVYPGANPTTNEVARVVRKYRDWFLELQPTAEKEAQYKAILILFPDLSPRLAPDVIDSIQAALKPEFVAVGLMIGQFHARCEEPALWNHEFRPLRSPVPLLAIRHMVRTDAPFLAKDADWLAAYLERFGEAVPNRLQPVVREAASGLGLELPAS
jgi:hypothetical protein